ncbi:hypothetical protein BZA77DRAFT_319389 [Pyronema omphalodes]|nr:hypothetical protein BZA77DRAFT_319389 [Pyronema omphalodes]
MRVPLTATRPSAARRAFSSSATRANDPVTPLHHDIPSFQRYARAVGLTADKTVYVGTMFEYTVLSRLSRLGMSLTRCGGRSDRGIDLRGTWTPPVPPSLRLPFKPTSFPSSVDKTSQSSSSPELEGPDEIKARLKAGLSPSSEAAYSAQDWIPASSTKETWAWEPTSVSGTALEPEPESELLGKSDEQLNITAASETTPGDTASSISPEEGIVTSSSSLEATVTKTSSTSSGTGNESNESSESSETAYKPTPIPVLVQCKSTTKSGPKYLRELEGTLGLVAPNTPAIGILCATTPCTPGIRKHLVLSRRALVFAYITPPEFSIEQGDNMPMEDAYYNKIDPEEAEREFNEAERRRKEVEDAERERKAAETAAEIQEADIAAAAEKLITPSSGEAAEILAAPIAIPEPLKKKRGRPRKLSPVSQPEPEISTDDTVANSQAESSSSGFNPSQPPSSLNSASLRSGGILKQLLWNQATANLIGRGVGVGERYIESTEGLKTEVVITVDGVVVEDMVR